MYRLQLCTALICPLCGTTTASLPVEIGCIIEGCLYAADKDRKYCPHRHTYSTTLQVPVPRPPSPIHHPTYFNHSTSLIQLIMSSWTLNRPSYMSPLPHTQQANAPSMSKDDDVLAC
ncbi:uncharacterized protein BO66DRAFT_152469 [Aspergillus aculeatinus CBS 121060]|uniref:Uncharacterized protein n=1 Tax=Aspergillus aculeatinus CBS 121060 TaxID=1448322 RepID=A0ACD1H1S7_9EURO|nr:hypothetical protein BO66DRAFT_152469 [Aspergillus aculeatinus CBS 121060]RAH67497.1 hypothetical protein BO66DRAFT_152469 [Aspergillus aculeatinus CBS 121060]